jgi:hypothetical protein
VSNIGLLIADEVQLVGGTIGPTYEVVISRTRYVSAQTEVETRVVACSVSLANARDLGEWMGVPSHNIFNFPPKYVFNFSSDICRSSMFQCASTRSRHSLAELLYPPFPLFDDRNVKTCLSRNRGVFSY